ncbi:Non-specific lipid-transfer protein 2G [Triticum urartu]|uniref:Non-specific lipid-transfer protein 2G n=1 Tax=Triticum urartu TaxID=4572 RepID=M7YYL5_TRIUA|nr:non-specific lipid-transfer protein 2P-like [Triticum urartu]EMS52281.1 Non-specific lipid-transfer protein 2G [Triticum urartu]
MAMRKEVLLAAMMLAVVVAAPDGVRAACEVGQLTVCMPAITTGAKPSGACCGNLRAQQACFCQYAKDPSLGAYIRSPHARETLVSCGLAVPHC